MAELHMASGNPQRRLLEIHTGCMGSGKTTRLINRVIQLANHPFSPKRCLILKFHIDDRYAQKEEQLVTHCQQELFAGQNVDFRVIDQDWLLSVNFTGYQVVALDEAHFAKSKTDEVDDTSILAHFVRLAWHQGVETILVASVDTWFSGEPVLSLQNLYPLATKIVKKPAFCHQCKQKTAIYSTLREDCHANKDGILVGGFEKYRLLCYSCRYE